MTLKVNTTEVNPSLVSIINDYAQVLPVDANFFISFDRTSTVRGAEPIDFRAFEKFWLRPLMITFPYLAVHEAVVKEIVNAQSKKFVGGEIQANRLLVLEDNNLTPSQESYRCSIEKVIAKETAYEPELDNSNDRGEVKSLSYIASKPLNYFCSHDSTALRLLEEPLRAEIGLSGVGSLRIYELLYYLRRMKMVDQGNGIKGLKMLYKYLYYLTPNEKVENPEWGQFCEQMDTLYLTYIQTSTGKPAPIFI